MAFCAAVEPKHGGRDVDNQTRELNKAWKEKKRPPSSLGDTPSDNGSSHRRGQRDGVDDAIEENAVRGR